MLFNDLQAFFSHTPLLKRLVLETMGEINLLDANRWQELITTKLPRLTNLKLNISPEENTMSGDDVLIPFQSSFWTIEKHWHMACLICTNTQSCAILFSVPYFAPSEVWYPSSEGFCNYSIIPYSFDDSYTKLRVSYFPSSVLIQSPFKHIRSLSLECTTDNIDHLQKVVNLSSVYHLIMKYSGECRLLFDLLKSAPYVHQLTMSRKTLMEAIDYLQGVYQQIKTLNLDDALLIIDIDRICHVFPNLEHITSFTKDRDVILRIINGFENLISANFKYTHLYKTPSLVTDQWLQVNNIGTDDAYQLGETLFYLWID